MQCRDRAVGLAQNSHSGGIGNVGLMEGGGMAVAHLLPVTRLSTIMGVNPRCCSAYVT